MKNDPNIQRIMFYEYEHDFKSSRIQDTADGKMKTKYPKTIVYRENTITIGVELIMKFAYLSKDAIRVLDWVSKNLEYNSNRIFISPVELSRIYECDRKHLSAGIRQLINEKILIRANTLNAKYKSLSDSCYVVNIDYMMKGNNRYMRDALKEEKNSIIRYENSLKEHEQKVKEEAKRTKDLIDGNY